MPDFSSIGKSRVAAITLGGVVLSAAVAATVVSYTTTFMDPHARLLTWIAAIGLPIVLSAPVFYLFASKLRELAIIQLELQFTAAHDALTSCLTRGAFVAQVRAQLAPTRPDRVSAGGGLLVIDADFFKRVNDRHGHPAGDEALRLIALSIKDALRTTDLVGRIGGEEFAVFLPDTDLDHAAAVAERIRANVGALAFSPLGHPQALSVSIGGVTFRGDVEFSDLFTAADAKLYAAKNNGRDRVEFARAA